MMQKRTISVDCLFLPDTQMAVLEQEQQLLRARLSELNPGGRLPFNLLPPFCLCPSIENAGKLRIEAPIEIDGWIVRPLTLLSASEKIVARAIPSPDLLAGFPPLPEVAAFILGYAGANTPAIIGSIAAQSASFTVNVWYYATLTATVEVDEHTVHGCRYLIGEPVWQKAATSAKPGKHRQADGKTAET